MKTFDVYPLNNINIVRAEAEYLWDEWGTKYLDMYGGHAVISIGHTAPRYVEYLEYQLSKIGFYSNSVIIEPQVTLAEKLGELCGKPSYELFMCNSGAEANENAIKLASFHNEKKRVVCFTNSFHGRTSLAVAATDNPKIVAPVNQTSNVTFLEYNNIEELRAEFARGGISSVIVEPVQGVGGVKVATKEFLVAIRELCDSYDAVMISDCVQCGCGRTGKYFALDYAGVEADIYSMAKGIGNGFPIGAIIISPKIKASYGLLGTTFGGNHLACAAALAVVDDMTSKNLIKNAAKMGHYIMEKLLDIKSDKIVEVRGKGLMIGIELNQDAKVIRNYMLYDKNIFVSGAADSKVVRILPPLTISRGQCDTFIEAFKEALQQ